MEAEKAKLRAPEVISESELEEVTLGDLVLDIGRLLNHVSRLRFPVELNRKEETIVSFP